jgi:small-conductance mechanosensitive channel
LDYSATSLIDLSVSLGLPVVLALLTHRLTRGWLRLRKRKLVVRIHNLRTDIDNFWFGEDPEKHIESLRDLVLNVDISPRLRSEAQNWFSPGEFKEKLPEPAEKEVKQPEHVGSRQLPIQYTLPSRNWWWRLARLLRSAMKEFKLNETNYTTDSSLQLEAAKLSSGERRYVYADLQPEEFKECVQEFERMSRHVGGIITSLYRTNLAEWGPPILVLTVSLGLLVGLSYALAPSANVEHWLPTTVIGLYVIVVFLVLSPALGWALHQLTRDLDWSSGNLLAELVRGMVVLVLLGVGLYYFFASIPNYAVFGLSVWLGSTWEDRVGRALVIGGAAILAFVVTEDTVTYALERMSKRFKFAYDETFAMVSRLFVLGYVVLFASAAYVLGFAAELGISTPDTVVLIYTLVGTIITALIGYASRDSIESFFAGVMLRVNPTFEVGDRIIIEEMADKRICDVKEIGLRTVRLYDIMSNTEMFVPNKKLSDMVITNVSRPDLELRVQVTVMIRAGTDAKTSTDTLSLAERMLIDIAYQEPEVDQAAVSDEETRNTRGRLSIEAAWKRLTALHRDVAVLDILTAEDATWHRVKANEAMDTALQDMIDARSEYRSFGGKAGDEKRLAAIKKIIDSYHILCRTVDSLAESRSWLQNDELLHTIRDELSKEPIVSSKFGIVPRTDYVNATLNLFALNLQRRIEVENRLNEAILQRLSTAGLLYEDLSSKD